MSTNILEAMSGKLDIKGQSPSILYVPKSCKLAHFCFFIVVGTIIGVAFGTFFVGLIVGAAVLFLFSKYRLKSKDEFEMLTKNEM